MFELPMSQGWAHYAWAVETQSLSPVRRVSKGYVEQERERRNNG
jgi:hypothetical protein